MKITQENLLKGFDDRGWIEEYKQSMGEANYQAYANKVYKFIEDMPEDSEMLIEKYVKDENLDLFAKHICRLAYLECFNLQFSADFTKLRRLENKKKTK